MEKESSNGFKLFQGKSSGPFTPFNLINQSFPEANLFPNSLTNQMEELSRSQKGPEKSKIIEKGKEKEEGKRYDRGGNCVASNTSKLFIKILNKRLSRFPVVEQYLNFYEIYSQKQNILLIPLCLYSFLKQREPNVQGRFLGSEVAHSKHNTQQKLNTRHIYSDIITELKEHIECSLENSRTKYKDCSDSKKQFHLKNISIYNKISDIIRKVQQLAHGLKDNGEHRVIERELEKGSMESEGAQREKNSSSKEISSDIKIEQEELHYNQLGLRQKENSQQIQKSTNLSHQNQHLLHAIPYDLTTLQTPLESLYERKQREYQKAMDKVYSVIMNERPLRDLFHIYKLNVQQILIESVNYCYRRNINSRVKKNQKIIKDIYERLQNQLFDALQFKNREIKEYLLRGWQFVIAFLTLQVAGDKKAEIYDEFKENIKRKTKYFSLVQSPSNSDPKEAFDSQYYSYSLRILQQHYETQIQRKKDSEKDNLRDLHEKMKEWIIGYFYNAEVNRICLEEPKLLPRISAQKNPETERIIGQAFLHPSGNQIILTTLGQKSPEVKKEEDQFPFSDQMSRKSNFFGPKEERALQKLMFEFQNLSKENYENFY